MELKEYLKIIRENKGIFWLIVFVVVLAGTGFFLLRPVSYGASLTLNITRQGSQDTPDYKFDGFYRLQADEKFAETVVQWLKSPRTVVGIYSKAGIDPGQASLRRLGRAFKPEKLSPQVVAVSFSAENPQTAKKISDSIVNAVAENAENLNKNQNEPAWFGIAAHEPVIVKNTFDPIIVSLASLLIGILISFWAVMVIHYIK